MVQEKKVEIYQKTYELLKGFPQITDLERPEEQDDLELEGKIGPIAFSYSLKIRGDLLKLQAEIPCPGRSVEEMLRFGKDLTTKREEITCTAYDSKLILMESYLYHSETEEEVLKKLMDKPVQFARLLIDNLDEISRYMDHEEYGETEKNVNEQEFIPEESAESKEDIQPDEDSWTEPEKPLSDQKEEFFQYCRDQKLLIEEEKKEMQKIRDSLDAMEKNLSKKARNLKKREEELSGEKKRNRNAADDLKKERQELEKEREALLLEREKHRDESVDQRMILRRKELERMESAYFEKEEEFQKFEKDTLDMLEIRLNQVKEAEEQLSVKKEENRRREEEIQKEREELDEKRRQIEESDKSLKILQMELSDKESELKMAQIHRTEAENLKKRMNIAMENISRKKDELKSREDSLKKKEEHLSDMEKEEEKRIKDIKVLKEKVKESEDENSQLREQISRVSERLRSMEDLKEKTEEKNAKLIEKAEAAESAADKVLSENLDLKNQNSLLENRANELENECSQHSKAAKELELTIARIRGELYELKEKNNDSEVRNLFMEKEKLETRINELEAVIDKNPYPEREWELEDGSIDGLAFEPVIGEKDNIYHAFINGSDIYLDLLHRIVQIEKPIRQIHRKKLEMLNGMDLSMSFFQKGKKVIGRKYGGESAGEAISILLRNLHEN